MCLRCVEIRRRRLWGERLISACKHVVKRDTVVIHSDVTDSEVMLLAPPFCRSWRFGFEARVKFFGFGLATRASRSRRTFDILMPACADGSIFTETVCGTTGGTKGTIRTTGLGRGGVGWLMKPAAFLLLCSPLMQSARPPGQACLGKHQPSLRR